MPYDKVKHVSTSSKLHDNCQMSTPQEQLSEMYYVWVRNTEPACHLLLT